MMRRAIRLARRGMGWVSPNPMVGAVIVKDGQIVAEGFHRRFGSDHAEVDALRKLDFRADGCDMYVNLEPCSHYGKTPPCAQAIIEAGIRTVHVAMIDPNPLVAGKGVAKLRRAGVVVELGVLETEARKLNETFLTYIIEKRPFVLLKAAMTLDGKIATVSGDSGQQTGGISGPEAHRYVQRLRRDLDAILVGAGTVLTDDPRLTCRLRGARQPLRVILDGHGRSPIDAQVFDTDAACTLVATTRKSPAAWRKALAARDVDVLLFPGPKGRIAVRRLLEDLAQRGVGSVLVEGGSEVHAAFLHEGLADRLDIIAAPRIVGGAAIPMVGGAGARTLDAAYRLEFGSVRKLGGDLLIPAFLKQAEETCSRD